MPRFIPVLVCLFVSLAAARGDTYLVLPFFNLTHNPNLDWVGESVAESIREALASQNLVALDRVDRQEAYRRLGVRPYTLLTRASVVKLGEALDAEQVISGQVEFTPNTNPSVKSRGSLQISASLLDLKRIRQGPRFEEAGSLENLATLQQHLAWQILKSSLASAAPGEAEFRKQHPPVRVDAIENYVRGLLASSTDEKHRFFSQASRLDASFSQPMYQLGLLYWEKKEYRPAAEWLQKVPSTDVHYREAIFFLGLCRYHLGDFPGAQSAFQLVANTVPLNEVVNNLGAAQSRRNLPDGLENFRKALEGDQSDPDYQFNVGYALWKNGEFARAADRFRAVLDREPGDADATLLLARCQKQSGPRPGESRTEGLERTKTKYEESAWWQLKALMQPGTP